MTWLGDVAPYATIQSLWGNSIRDRVVQTFTDINEANAHLASLPNGAVVHLDSDGTMLVKTAGVWRPVFPTILRGTNAAQHAIQPNEDFAWSSLTIPAGYRFALVSVFAAIDIGAGGPWYVTATQWLNGTGVLGSQSYGSGNSSPAPTQTIGVTTYAALDLTKANVITANIANHTGGQPMIFRTAVTDSQLNALCIP